MLCAQHAVVSRLTAKSNMAVKWLSKLFTGARVPGINFKAGKGIFNSSTNQKVKGLVNFSINRIEKYDNIWKKCVFCLGVCFGCRAGLQLFDWLKNKSFRISCNSFIVHAKTSILKSKQFNFVADVVEIIAPAVVHIESHGRHDGFLGRMMSSSSGSGFLVSEEGLILTNAHVVQNVRNVMVTLADGSSIVGDIVSLDRATDLALVRLRNPNKVGF